MQHASSSYTRHTYEPCCTLTNRLAQPAVCELSVKSPRLLSRTSLRVPPVSAVCARSLGRSQKLKMQTSAFKPLRACGRAARSPAACPAARTHQQPGQVCFSEGCHCKRNNEHACSKIVDIALRFA
jgi:hypothetical protein